VPVSTLAHILLEAGAPAVDLLKVDVEGMEERVLAGNDWEHFRPKVILVEATFPESPDRRSTNVQPFLEAQGYRHAYFDGLNDFYLERGFDVGNAFALPPNVFDGFTSGEIVHLRAENRYLKLDLDDFRGENRRLKAAVEEMHNEILALSRTIDSMHRLSSVLAESELRLKIALESELRLKSALESELRLKSALESELRLKIALESELRLKSALAEHQQRASMFETQLLGLTSSTSWRLTEPLRRLAGKGSLRTRRNLRRALKAAWWIMTPWQMPARIRVIRERKIASKAVPSQNPSASRAGVNDGGRKL
jgi:hypothetical protein